MRRAIKQHWPFLAGLLTGYICWDIVDQTVLQPRGWFHSYIIDWSVAGIVGFATWYVRGHYERVAPEDQSEPEHAEDLVQAQATLTINELHQLLDELNMQLGNAFTEQGIAQQRSIRQAIIAVHQSQSLTDELRGLIAHHRVETPTHELHEPPVVPASERRHPI